MVAQVGLLAWIIISAGLFALLKPIRAFALTYVIGILLLPVEQNFGTQGAISITMSLRIDKFTACNLGALLGTILFAHERLTRYRWNWFDLAYLTIPAGLIATSALNGIGLYDGISCAVADARIYLPLIFLTKVHVTTAPELYQVLRTILGGAFVYAFIAVAEFRLSPRLHSAVWGYFPHSFDQFMRYQHFRPLGMFRHALEMAGFMSVSSLLAVWLWYKKNLPPLWGFVPGWAVVAALLVGLASTMTFSGYGAFLVGLGILALLELHPRRWFLLILPVVVALWMLGRYTDVFDAGFLVRAATSIDPARAESVQYRMDAETMYLNAARSFMWLGMSSTLAMGTTSQSEGALHAIDAYWLIQLAFNGLIGLLAALVVWTGAIWQTFAGWRRMTPEVRTLALFIATALGLQLIDFLFNAFPSPFLMMANVGLISVLLRRRQVRRAVFAVPTNVPGLQTAR